MKRLLSLILSVVLTLTIFSCAPTETQSKEVTVWTATGTEKVLQDYDYSKFYGNKTLSISAVRNEYESAQIILTGEKGVEYDITLSDLKSADGTILSKDCFEVYNQKYLYISKIKDSQAVTQIGWYPDALLPFEKAKEYDENITGGKNQGIWVTLKTTKDQKAGVYQGNFTVSAGGKNYAVPVSVTVYDYTMTDAKHTKSSFMISAEEVAWGEFDSTVELIDTYTEFLLDFRLDPEHLPGNDMVYAPLTGDSLESFLYYAEKYTRDIRCSHYNLPFMMDTAVLAGETIKSVDFDVFEDTLYALAERSVEKGVNLIEKAGTYFIFFDEHDQNGSTHIANYNLSKAESVCKAVAQDLETSLECDDADLKARIIKSIAGIKHKLVGKLSDAVTAHAQMVPTIDVYNSEENRKMYADFDYECYGDEGELWTYTCVGPRIPYPTYHGEDILLSSRIYSWMMYEYNIVGNLYWDTALYAWRKESFGDLQLYDYYDTALRYPGANLDGFLMYPGKPYGIYGPVASIRLHSIRDGNEDYEIMYALEQIYRERGVSEEAFDELLQYTNTTLYSGAVVRNRDELVSEFAFSRETLNRLLELAQNQGVVITKAKTIDGKATFNFSAPASVAVKINGTAVSGTEEGNYKVYAHEQSLDKDINHLTIETTKEGKTYSATINLGGKSAVVNASTLEDKTTMTSGGTKESATIGDKSVLTLNFNANTRLSADIEILSLNITENTESFTIEIYSANGGEVITLLAKGSAGASFTDLRRDLTLEQGWNTITIPATSFKADQYGKAKTLRINIAGTDATTISIGNIVTEG